MDSLVGYGSDDENESERYVSHLSSVGGGHAAHRRRDDDTNYDSVNMDMSEDSQGAESEPELPPAEPAPSRHSSQDERRGSGDSRDRDQSRDRNRSRESDRDRRDRRRDSPARSRTDRDRPDRDRPDRDRPDRRSPRRDDRFNRSDRNERGRGFEGSSRRGLLGDRPDDRGADGKVPALMDLKPFGGEPPPGIERSTSQSRDARDAVSPRFTDRERRDRDRGDRERDRDRHSRRSEEKRSHRPSDRRDRSRSRGAAFPPPSASTSNSGSNGDRRGSPPSGDYRPSSYKVNKKLEVMEKMGLQIKTPDGSMATARQLRAAAGDGPAPLPQYYNPTAINASKILDQVQKRKLLWGGKAKAEAEPAGAAQWSGARFAQDSDGRQASKFMRLMGIKDPAAVKVDKPAAGADGMKKQEELFQAMQAQYDVARATTHTMRGVGLGFSRGQY